MKKVVYICDGCGKQDDEVTKRKTVQRYYGRYVDTVKQAPEGWSRVVIDRKGADICSPECASKAIDAITAKAIEAAQKKADAAKAKAEKAKVKAEKSRAKLVAV